eukprot:TRINITY_DN566_c1_g1_i1.p1 TRINITY_DN566_c1_g1~~TRINITY_DN566_c1_g1_i1.p1  ORF type:complete len:298 (-),score=45.69 TRINITY_DN566_c1_g1_i1:89-955(-)
MIDLDKILAPGDIVSVRAQEGFWLARINKVDKSSVAVEWLELAENATRGETDGLRFTTNGRDTIEKETLLSKLDGTKKGQDVFVVSRKEYQRLCQFARLDKEEAVAEVEQGQSVPAVAVESVSEEADKQPPKKKRKGAKVVVACETLGDTSRKPRKKAAPKATRGFKVGSPTTFAFIQVDPTFASTETELIKNCCSNCLINEAFRAVHINSAELLRKVIDSANEVPDLKIFRSSEVHRTPLCEAIIGNKTELVEMLLEEDANTRKMIAWSRIDLSAFKGTQKKPERRQ